ncbi:altronate dehydratase family protein [soil metagenome]
MQKNVLKVHPSDDLIVALTDLKKGSTIRFEGVDYLLQDDIAQKHKFAARDFAVGDPLHMYGILVGRAVVPIPKGGAVTIHNVKHAAAPYTGRQTQPAWQPPDVSRWKGRTFMGYHRSDGQVGTANHWLVIPLVFCENRNIGVMREALEKELGYDKAGVYQHQSRKMVERYRAGVSVDELLLEEEVDSTEDLLSQRLLEHVDGIKFLTHQGGCGGTRQDAQSLCGLLAGYINHPNVAGATVLSLGCQNAQVSMLQEELHQRNPHFDKPLYIFEQQGSGSEYQMISRAIRQTFAGLIQANELRRAPAPLSKLVLGMECGGSDGFSGLSANPAMGYAADLLVALGGTAILSEFPELCGVEQELINRCVDDSTADRFMQIQSAYAARAQAVGSGFDMNPSPGNIKDGLITDAIKSAGAARKGGTSPITDVLDYPEYIRRPGLNLLCTPGNDVESTTGLAGAGANLILFSTGLGTPTGNPVTPVAKVASNSRLAKRMADIIDIDTGTVIAVEDTIESMGEKIRETCIRIASGEVIPKAVQLGQDDFIPWKRGVSL